MQRLAAFNSISLDGYFTDSKGDMSWAHQVAPDPEFDAFVANNASGGGMLVFGRVTYELMASYWPTPLAMQNDAAVAERMNALPKLVASRTMTEAAWQNTRIVSHDLSAEIRKLKRDGDRGMTILGSGSVVSQLAEEGLIDEYQVVVVPVVLGAGRTMFEGVPERMPLKLTGSRAFSGGKVVLSYSAGGAG